MGERPICIVHISDEGELQYHVSGDAVFFVVDERAPHDRVYQVTIQAPREAVAALIGSSPIGSRQDSRHAAVERRLTRALEGKSHLEVVGDND